jgi:hypothetical protein
MPSRTERISHRDLHDPKGTGRGAVPVICGHAILGHPRIPITISQCLRHHTTWYSKEQGASILVTGIIWRNQGLLPLSIPPSSLLQGPTHDVRRGTGRG